jgi:hypothetical protein
MDVYEWFINAVKDEIPASYVLQCEIYSLRGRQLARMILLIAGDHGMIGRPRRRIRHVPDIVVRDVFPKPGGTIYAFPVATSLQQPPTDSTTKPRNVVCLGQAAPHTTTSHSLPPVDTTKIWSGLPPFESNMYRPRKKSNKRARLTLDAYTEAPTRSPSPAASFDKRAAAIQAGPLLSDTLGSFSNAVDVWLAASLTPVSRQTPTADSHR